MLFISLKSVQVVCARFAWFVPILQLANFRDCWLLQRKDAHGWNCQGLEAWPRAGDPAYMGAQREKVLGRDEGSEFPFFTPQELKCPAVLSDHSPWR